MPLRWKIFAIANYISLLGYGYLLIKTYQFYNNLDEAWDNEGILMSLSMLILFLNSLVNILIFHRYFPDKLLTSTVKILITSVSILFAIALIYFLFTLFKEIITLNLNDYESYDYLMLFITAVASILGIFIFVTQITTSKYLQKNNQSSLHNLIDNIGQE